MSNLVLVRKSEIITRRLSLMLPRHLRSPMAQVRGPHLSPMIVNPFSVGAHVPGSGYGFDPTNLANLKAWWRADAGITLTGSAIDAIADQSGNGNNGTLGTANKATLVAAVTGSLPVMRFLSATETYYTFPASMMSGATAASIYYALHITNDPSFLGDQGGLHDFSSQGGNSSHFPFTDSNVYDGFGSATRFSTGNPTPSLAAWRRINIKAQSSGYAMFIDNASHFSNATSCGSSWLTTAQIGRSKGTTIRFVGDILEVILFTDVKNSTDRGTLDTYLADRISGTWYAT